MNPIKTFTSTWQYFKRDMRGIAAVEFAIAAPILIMLCFGGFEFSRNILTQLKLEKMAFSIADVTSQNESLTNTQISDIFNAAEEIFLPTDFSSSGVVYISSVYRAAGDAYPTVKWQRSGGGTATQTSQVGSTGLTATLPNSLTINEKDNVIVVEAYYTYVPMFRLGGIFASSQLMYKTTVFKPRLGDLTTNPT